MIQLHKFFNLKYIPSEKRGKAIKINESLLKTNNDLDNFIYTAIVYDQSTNIKP